MSTGDRQTILLFGKTGDGKSTVGNMLSTGDLDGEFKTGSSLDAVTRETKGVLSSDSKWNIIDTVGLFATDIRNSEARKRDRELRNYLKKSKSKIDLFCYIKKASKFTRADEECWKDFNTLILDISPRHDHQPHNILLIFTSCPTSESHVGAIAESSLPQGSSVSIVVDEELEEELGEKVPKDEWLHHNEMLINQKMQGPIRYPRVGVDFPPRHNDPRVESNLEAIRADSLKRLKLAVEDSLINVSPPPQVIQTSNSSMNLTTIGVLIVSVVVIVVVCATFSQCGIGCGGTGN